MSTDYVAAASAAYDADAARLVSDTGDHVGPHECQNGDGRRAAYVLVDLEDGRADLICGLCLMAMMAAVSQQVGPPGAAVDSDTPAAGA